MLGRCIARTSLRHTARRGPVGPGILYLFLVCCAAGVALAQDMTSGADPPPPSFPWGVASASYQIEGAWNEDGRGPSIWDTFSQTPGKVHNGDNGDTADDFYHRFQDDIEIMRSLGVKMFRMSLSWSRILPAGTGKVNQTGLDFYTRVIAALLEAGIQPFVTLYHWDLPQALEDKYGGWLDEQVVEDFAAYAQVCFKAFGKRVQHWTTFNEPLTFVFQGYSTGTHAPGRCSDRSICAKGDSGSEPWVVTHNVLRAHAAAVQQLRKIAPKAQVSINFNSDWAEPLTQSDADKAAAARHLDFMLGLYADPIYLGDYPASVRQAVPWMPQFTAAEKAALKGSCDFFALNHYTSQYVGACLDGSGGPEQVSVTPYRDGNLIGPQADSEWLYVVPWGIRALIGHISTRYSGPPGGIWITENGVDVPNEASQPYPAVLADTFRTSYYQTYLQAIMDAVQSDGADIRGYFAWSIMDNFEWADGYAKRFGIVYIDYSNNVARSIKDSAKWLASYFGGQNSEASQ